MARLEFATADIETTLSLLTSKTGKPLQNALVLEQKKEHATQNGAQEAYLSR